MHGLGASSYETGNWAGLVTRRIFWLIHMGNFSPVGRNEIRNTTKMVLEHKFVLLATVVALWTVVT